MNINKTIIKIGMILSIFIIMFSFNTSYASSISDIFTGGDDFIKSGSGNGVNKTDLKATSDLIYKILMVLGISIAVIMSGILGIRFMMGSTEDKAQVKEQLIPFIIGCIVIFGAFSIWSVVVNIGEKLDESSSTPSSTTTYCPNCGAVVNFQMLNSGSCSSCGGSL